MAYQTKDGLTFNNEQEAQDHANGLGYFDDGNKASSARDYDKAIYYYDLAIPLLSSRSSKAKAYGNRGNCYYNRSEYDKAIDDYTSAIGECGSSGNIGGYYLDRGDAYNKKGNKDQAIADWKEAADIGANEYFRTIGDKYLKPALENLAKNGVQYTPQKPQRQSTSSSSSSSSSTSSSEKKSPVVRFFQAIGFEDIDYFGYQINIPVSILLSLVITACITFLAYLFIPQKAVIVAIVSLVLSFLAFACTHKALRVILIIIAAIGLALGVYTFVSPSKSKPATTQTQTQTATVNANVNFRKEPTTGDNIIRQLQQGETVTLTGETNGGWTQIKHGNDTGWISTEFLEK